ncbi:MAG: hypothetical protein IIX90_00660 [Clostridia bacterium]|nr:hypothetical protein [Clostridia bacterium]
MPLYMPQMYKKEASRSMTANFYGLNHNLKISDGEWFDMENLTSDHLPVAAVRGKREKMKIEEEWLPKVPVAATVRAASLSLIPEPIWIERDGMMRFPMLEYEIDLTRYGYIKENYNHSITMMGALAVILPEMIYVNVYAPLSEGAIGNVSRKKKYNVYFANGIESGYAVRLSVCDNDGVLPTYVSADKPESYEENEVHNGDTWFGTGNISGLFRYDEDTKEWYSITSYVAYTLEEERVTADGEKIRGKERFDVPGGVYEGVVLSIGATGSTAAARSKIGKIKNAIGNKMVIGGDSGRFWVTGGIGSVATIVLYTKDDSIEFSIGRAVPQMDYVIEAGNRLWGCRFRESQENPINEIYCSQRGNIFNWIAGPSDNDDSAVTFSVGEGGRFTGAVNFNGTPIFFKENRMIRVDGFGASGFVLNDATCAGVGLKSNNSTAMVNNVLYYKSARDIMRYDGSIPVSVSGSLGDLGGYIGEYAGAVGNKYYVQLEPKTGEYLPGRYIAVLDTIRGVWTKETPMTGIWLQVQDEVYGISAGEIKTIRGQNATRDFEKSEETVRWYAESGIIGLETPDEKYITKLAIRLKLEAGAQVRVLVQYDSSGEWEQVMAAEFSGMRTVTVPVHPHRHDHMRYRLEGEGDCQIFSVTKTLERAGRR